MLHLVYYDKTLSFDSNWDLVITIVEEVKTQEAHNIINISAIYANPDANLTLMDYVNNIKNYTVKKSYAIGSLMLGEPRRYGAILSIKY
jgi:hypothetical protein